jgi:hypothetical protein
MQVAGIPRKLTVTWNLIPWWNGTRKVTATELRQAAECIGELLTLLPNIRAVVLVGRRAAKAEKYFAEAGLPVFTSAHPSPLVRAKFPNRWNAIPLQWAKVLDIVAPVVSEKGHARMSTEAAVSSTTKERLKEQARDLHRLLNELPQHHAITDTLDYVLGALFGLLQAETTGFKERIGGYVPEYHAHVANYAMNLSEGRQLNSVWLAGFYFNSGIQRLAAAFDRVPKMLGAANKGMVDGKKKPTTARDRMTEVNSGDWANWEKVYDEVNAFKHSPEGRATGRTVTMEDAVAASAEVLDLLAQTKSELNRRFSL